MEQANERGADLRARVSLRHIFFCTLGPSGSSIVSTERQRRYSHSRPAACLTRSTSASNRSLAHALAAYEKGSARMLRPARLASVRLSLSATSHRSVTCVAASNKLAVRLAGLSAGRRRGNRPDPRGPRFLDTTRTIVAFDPAAATMARDHVLQPIATHHVQQQQQQPRTAFQPGVSQVVFAADKDKHAVPTKKSDGRRKVSPGAQQLGKWLDSGSSWTPGMPVRIEMSDPKDTNRSRHRQTSTESTSQ